MHAEPVLAIDLGGTKLLVALVDGARVVERAERPTDRAASPAGWLDAIAELAQRWTGRYARVAVSVTGPVIDGRWSALNPGTLCIPDGYPLAQEVERRLKVPALTCNDAQAAAWGEYVHGAGGGRDLAFLTVSTGIGGGAVLGGRLLIGRSGLAGSFGQLRPLLPGGGEARLEDCASGRWIAAEARRQGHDLDDARTVFAAAADGTGWAERIVDASAAAVARLCANIQLVLDPQLIVIGGGIGLAAGYRQRVDRALAGLPAALRPTLQPAALGANAGIIGVAALAQASLTRKE